MISYNASVFQIAMFNEYNINAIQNGTSEWAMMNGDDTDYTRFTGSTWRKIYDTKRIAEHRELFLVIDRFAFNLTQDGTNASLKEYFPLRITNSDQRVLQELISESPDWIRYDKFYDLSDRTDLLSATEWPVSAHVDHAFSHKIQANSRLQLSLGYILVVIACNVLKLSVMIWTLAIDRSSYIVTLGDGIESFLRRPDLITRTHCMLGKDEILFKLGYMPYHQLEGEELDTHMLRVDGVWLPQKRRHFALIGQGRQVFFALL